MLVAAWIAFVLFTLFLLGSAVGSFLNVCIVRLPQGRSLIRPASCCGQCHKPIRSRDNVPLLSYWLLRGRCRACGAPFSMRYFWIELLTGFLFVFIYHFEIARNVHHFRAWAWYEGTYENLLTRTLNDPSPWLFFAARATLVCFLIVATGCTWEVRRVPGVVTCAGVLAGIFFSLLFPWPWPEYPSPHFGPRPRIGLVPSPLWEPLPEWLPPGSLALGLSTSLSGILTGALSFAFLHYVFNFGVRRVLDWGEASILMIAGSFLGWQLVLVAVSLAFAAAVVFALVRGTLRQGGAFTFGIWLSATILAVEMGWYWMEPSLAGLFYTPTGLLLLGIGFVALCLGIVPLLRWTQRDGLKP